jgi:hypothetical protein
MHKLLIKTHNVTGLKYLCYTQRENHNNYNGSGKYWRDHLKKHGKNISTELIFQSEDYSEFVKKAIEFSDKFNVVESEEWANLIIERGEGGDTVSTKSWITDGNIDKYHSLLEEIPAGWRPGRSRCVFNDSNKQKELGKRSNHNTEKQKKASAAMGKRNGKPFTLNGITYPSKAAACTILNISKGKLYTLIKNDNRIQSK